MQAADLTSAAPATARSGERPAVSVIVPCYNGARFLDSLMASLASQTFRDFEIVIVDDGSDDDETLRKLASLADRARVIRQDNAGPAAARNAAIRAARADIVAMVDCDDTVDPRFLAETVPLLAAAPSETGMVVTHARLSGTATGVSRCYFNRFDLLFTNTLSVALVLRKRCWLAVGGYDESMRDGYEDWDFSLRLAEAGFRAIEVPKPLYNYYIHSVSRSSSVNGNRLHARLWRTIRYKRAQNYRLMAMLRLWMASRDGSGGIPLWKGLAAYMLTNLLPDAWFSWLIAALRGHADASPTPESGRLHSLKGA
jgi:glycosyltransferase involved in cell wall biosynthesis